MKRKADGEYKLGPVSGMVRGLRYGEEDDSVDEIGDETDPRDDDLKSVALAVPIMESTFMNSGDVLKTLTATKVPLEARQIEEYHKELLSLMSNVTKKLITATNFQEFHQRLSQWTAEYGKFGKQLESSFEGILREARYLQGEGKLGPREFDRRTNDAEHFLKYFSTFWKASNMQGQMPYFNRSKTKDSEQLIKSFRQNGLSEDQINSYLLDNPLPTQEEHDANQIEKWYPSAIKWANKMKRSFLESKKWQHRALESLGDFIEVSVQNTQVETIEGFKVIMENWSWEYQEGLERMKQSLKELKSAGAKRYPSLNTTMLPIKIEWDGVSSSNAAGTYEGTHILVTTYGLMEKSPTAMSAILAHELGHHLYKKLSRAGQKYWDMLIRGDYARTLDLRDLVKVMSKLRVRSVHSPELEAYDPELAIQAQTLEHRNDNLISRSSIERYLERGGESIASVPQNPITGYAGKNEEEAFCEAFSNYLIYGQRSLMPQVYKWLHTTLPQMKKANRKATPLDNWEFAEDEDTSTGGAEGYFADAPYYRETREFAESGENTNDADIDPKASKNTPPTPDQIEQDDDVKTLGRVKIEELSVKQDKKASATARLLSEWKLLGEE